MTASIEALKVHVENLHEIPSPESGTASRTSTFRTVTSATTAQTGTQAIQLLGQSSKRRRAVITFVGQSTDVAYLCGSQADAQGLQGAIVMGLQVVYLTGADEVWIGIPVGATDLTFGVVAEFE